MKNYNLVFLDTETTGNTPEDRLCQLAYKQGDYFFDELFNPGKKIPPEASAVSHITNKMVADKPSFQESEHYPKIKALLEDPNTITVAHNAIFDVGMLANDGIKISNYICTMKVVRYLDKECKMSRYNLQYLRYYLEMEVEAQAHDAKGDVIVLEQLFLRLKEDMKLDLGINDEEDIIKKMLEITREPSMIMKFNFGKHNGRRVSEIAKEAPDYLQWLLKQKMQSEQGEEDWIYTLKHYLGEKTK